MLHTGAIQPDEQEGMRAFLAACTPEQHVRALAAKYESLRTIDADEAGTDDTARALAAATLADALVLVSSLADFGEPALRHVWDVRAVDVWAIWWDAIAHFYRTGTTDACLAKVVLWWPTMRTVAWHSIDRAAAMVSRELLIQLAQYADATLDNHPIDIDSAPLTRLWFDDGMRVRHVGVSTHAPDAQRGLRGALFLGSAKCAYNVDWLVDTNIRAVFSIGHEFRNHRRPKLVRIDHALRERHTSVQRWVLPVRDGHDENIHSYDPRKVAALLARIHEARQRLGNVLIHCHEGRSRSVTITIMYLLDYIYPTHTPVDAFYDISYRRGYMHDPASILADYLAERYADRQDDGRLTIA